MILRERNGCDRLRGRHVRGIGKAIRGTCRAGTSGGCHSDINRTASRRSRRADLRSAGYGVARRRTPELDRGRS